MQQSIDVLVIEDSPQYMMMIEAALAEDGYRVRKATTGEDGLELARAAGPDVVVLDLVLPGVDGLEVCRQIRQFSDAYIVMLTSKDDEFDKILGLKVGADDYITKPFSPRELVTRISVLLRRSRQQLSSSAPEERSFGSLVVYPGAHEARVDGEDVNLTNIEFQLLDILSADPAIVHTRDALLERIWGAEWIGENHTVDVHIANLRKKIDVGNDGPSRIKTVRGVGFKMA